MQGPAPAQSVPRDGAPGQVYGRARAGADDGAGGEEHVCADGRGAGDGIRACAEEAGTHVFAARLPHAARRRGEGQRRQARRAAVVRASLFNCSSFVFDGVRVRLRERGSRQRPRQPGRGARWLRHGDGVPPGDARRQVSAAEPAQARRRRVRPRRRPGPRRTRQGEGPLPPPAGTSSIFFVFAFEKVGDSCARRRRTARCGTSRTRPTWGCRSRRRTRRIRRWRRRRARGTTCPGWAATTASRRSRWRRTRWRRRRRACLRRAPLCAASFPGWSGSLTSWRRCTTSRRLSALRLRFLWN